MIGKNYKNILVLTGGWRYNRSNSINIGDVAQLMHGINMLNQLFPGAKIKLIAHSLNDSLSINGINITNNFISTILKSRLSIISRFILTVINGSSLLFNAWLNRINKNTKYFNSDNQAVLQEFSDADLLFVTGSGTFNDAYWRGPASIWSLVILCAHFSNIPIVLLGQQIGPLRNRIARVIIGMALRRANFLGVRDRTSLKVAHSIGVKPNSVHFTGDEGFYLAPSDEYIVGKCLQKNGVEDTFIAAQFRIDKNCPFRESVNKFANILNTLSKRMNAMVVFVPFSYADNSDDRDACRLLSEKLEVNYCLLDLAGDASLIKGVLARARIAIGVANHFCVFAASVGVPTFGIYSTTYMAQKLRGIEQEYSHVKAFDFSFIEQFETYTDVMTSHSNKFFNNVHKKYYSTKPNNYFDWVTLVNRA